MPSYYESNYTGSEVDAAVKKIKDNVYVEKTTTINKKSLEQNVVLTASDIEGVASVAGNNPFTGNNTFTGKNTFEGENTFTTTVKFENNIQDTAGNVLTLPNKNGTIALMSDIEATLGKVKTLLHNLDTEEGVQVV